VNLAQDADLTGWNVGLVIGIVVVLAVVALVTPIIVLAHRIAGQAKQIDTELRKAEQHTAPLAALSTTIEHAETIVAGLERGRHRLGG
jgi:predicted Holliday junction resolvase-like endonuclease